MRKENAYENPRGHNAGTVSHTFSAFFLLALTDFISNSNVVSSAENWNNTPSNTNNKIVASITYAHTRSYVVYAYEAWCTHIAGDDAGDDGLCAGHSRHTYESEMARKPLCLLAFNICWLDRAEQIA